MAKNYVYTHTQTKTDYKRDRNITSKQWQVYYYLLSISYYDSQSVEDHRYVYKKEFSVAAAARFLGISRPTIYTALSNLKEANLIKETNTAYLLYARNWVKIEKETLKVLLSLTKNVSKRIDMLRIYLILKKLNEISQGADDRAFTRKDLIDILGHNTTTSIDYENVTGYLVWLSYLNLIEFKTHTAFKEGVGNYVVFHLQKINEITDKGAEMLALMKENEVSVIPETIKEKLKEII